MMNKIDVYCHKIEYYRYCYEHLSGDFCLFLSVPSRQTITLYCYSRDYRNGIRIRRRFSSVSYVHLYPSYCGENCDCTTNYNTTATSTTTTTVHTSIVVSGQLTAYHSVLPVKSISTIFCCAGG